MHWNSDCYSKTNVVGFGLDTFFFNNSTQKVIFEDGPFSLVIFLLLCSVSDPLLETFYIQSNFLDIGLVCFLKDFELLIFCLSR